MAHLCVPQNQALGVCRGFVPDIQVCGTDGKEDLINATITSNAEQEKEEENEEEEEGEEEEDARLMPGVSRWRPHNRDLLASRL